MVDSEVDPLLKENSKMTEEEIINELTKLKQIYSDKLIKINAEHDLVGNMVANLNYLIENVTKEKSDG